MVPWSVLKVLWTRKWRMRALLNDCRGKKRWFGCVATVHCWTQVSAMAGWERKRLEKSWKSQKGISNDRNQSPTILFLSTHLLWLDRWLSGQVGGFLDGPRWPKKDWIVTILAKEYRYWPVNPRNIKKVSGYIFNSCRNRKKCKKTVEPGFIGSLNMGQFVLQSHGRPWKVLQQGTEPDQFAAWTVATLLKAVSNLLVAGEAQHPTGNISVFHSTRSSIWSEGQIHPHLHRPKQNTVNNNFIVELITASTD